MLQVTTASGSVYLFRDGPRPTMKRVAGEIAGALYNDGGWVDIDYIPTLLPTRRFIAVCNREDGSRFARHSTPIVSIEVVNDVEEGR